LGDVPTKTVNEIYVYHSTAASPLILNIVHNMCLILYFLDVFVKGTSERFQKLVSNPQRGFGMTV